MSKRDTYVVVTVDTEGIVQKFGKTEGLVDIPKELVVFSDNRGDQSATGNDFISSVDKNTSIIWIGIAKKEGDTVQIIMVKSTGGKKILKPDFHHKNGIMEGKIKDVYENGKEVYSLTFQINDSGFYEIDPQLEMST